MASQGNPRFLLATIGVQFSELVNDRERDAADIERALLAGARGIFEGDLRIVNPLFSWVEKNGEYVNMERLKKLYREDVNRQSLVWIHALAFFGLSLGQTRWKILAVRQEKPLALCTRGQRPDIALLDSLKLQNIKGPAQWARESGFILSTSSIQTTSKFALSSATLAKISLPFFNRLLFGPNWRADIVTAIQNGATTPKAIREITNCSQEPAVRILREFSHLGLPNIEFLRQWLLARRQSR